MERPRRTFANGREEVLKSVLRLLGPGVAVHVRRELGPEAPPVDQAVVLGRANRTDAILDAELAEDVRQMEANRLLLDPQ